MHCLYFYKVNFFKTNKTQKIVFANCKNKCWFIVQDVKNIYNKCPKKLAMMTNKKIKGKSRCADCMANKSFSHRINHKSESEIFVSQFCRSCSKYALFMALENVFYFYFKLLLDVKLLATIWMESNIAFFTKVQSGFLTWGASPLLSLVCPVISNFIADFR